MTNPFIQDLDFFDRKISKMWFTGQGEEFVTHGDGAGNQGVWNAAGQVKGVWDAPVKTTWKSSAFQEGSTYRSSKRLHRDMELGFHITHTLQARGQDHDRSAEENESEFRKIFEYQPDEWELDPEPTTLHIETAQSGERKLDVLLHDTPVFEPDLDPVSQQYFGLILKLRAGKPMWYEDDVVTQASSGSSAATLQITVSNPTDQPMPHNWILTRATWSIPDVSWRGGRYARTPGGTFASRTITVPVGDAQGGCVISLDRAEDLMVRDVNYTNMLPLLGGKLFKHVIPPYTQPQTLTVSYTGAPAGGAMVQLVQPRRWSRPWGLE